MLFLLIWWPGAYIHMTTGGGGGGGGECYNEIYINLSSCQDFELPQVCQWGGLRKLQTLPGCMARVYRGSMCGGGGCEEVIGGLQSRQTHI